MDGDCDGLDRSLLGLLQNASRTGEEPDWEAFIRRAKSHPNESKCPLCHIDDDYRVLHLMMEYDPPLRAVETVYRSSPDAIGIDTEDGCALQIYCSHFSGKPCSEDVIRFLLRKRLDHNKDTGGDISCPFHFFGRTCRGMDALAGDFDRQWESRILKVLLEEHPAGILQDCGGHHPGLNEQGDRLEVVDDCGDAPLIEQEVLGWYEKAKDYVQEMEHDEAIDLLKLLLKAFHRATSAESASSVERHLLHLLVKYMVKRDDLLSSKKYFDHYKHVPDGFVPIISLIKERSPYHFTETYQDGNLPIHILLQNKVEMSHEIKQKILASFVEGCPETVKTPDTNGRLPLFLAIENGWPCGPIVEAAPDQLRVRDQASFLFPFQSAACFAFAGLVSDHHGDDAFRTRTKRRKVLSTPDDLLALNNTFVLLLEDPSLVVNSNPTNKM